MPVPSESASFPVRSRLTKVHDDTDSDAEILAVHGEDIVRSYIFEVRSPGDVSKAVSAAQHRLLQEARTMGYNALWREGYVPTAALDLHCQLFSSHVFPDGR